ncbi:MAG: hypothetical protein ABJH98_18090 [Reichenbachiella sp.]|uniref:hypothetical protein n=1 Tax=Reichenbachiella sp. TaxID=2184521 RepID=UPI003296B096
MKEFIEEHRSILAVQSFLKWCFNFRSEDIDKLCSESKEFKRVWEKYIVPSTKGSMTVDYLKMVEVLFEKVSFKTMQKVMDIALRRYEEEEANRLEFALEIQRKQEEMLSSNGGNSQ